MLSSFDLSLFLWYDTMIGISIYIFDKMSDFFEQKQISLRQFRENINKFL